MFMKNITPLSTIVEGSGPGLLLAHGGGGSIATNFGGIFGPLSEYFTVVAPDYPGSGRTPYALEPLELDTLSDQLVTTAVDSGVEKFAMLGYSLGCAVAIRAATRHADRITALVLTAGFARLDEASRLRAQVLQALAEKREYELLSRLLVGSLVNEEFLGEMDEARRESFVKKAAAGIPVGFAEQLDLTIRVDVRRDLLSISVPTLVIHAAREHLVSPRTGKDLDSIAGVEIAFLDTGHCPIDQSSEWLSLIQKFLLGVE